MYYYPIKRTPEEGHTPACWVKAITTALENERDALAKQDDKEYGSSGEHEFRIWLQDNGPLTEAEHLLKDGLTVCLCEPITKTELFDQIKHFAKE